MELEIVSQIERATLAGRSELFRLGTALLFVVAIIIAAIFEASGALVAGGEVVSTIKKGIIDPALITDTDAFVWLMLAALLYFTIRGMMLP